MVNSTCKIFFLLMLASARLFPGDAAFRSTLGAQAAARGGLYVAGADGLTTTFINPSGLAYLPQKGIQLAISSTNGTYEYKNQDDYLYRSFAKDDYNLSGGFYWQISPKMRIAVASYAAADYHVNWPYATYRTKGSTIYTAGYEMAHHVHIRAIAPTIAYQLGRLAIGISFNGYYTSQKTAFPVSNPKWFQGIGTTGYQFQYDLDGWSTGFNLGMMMDFSDHLRVGFSVRSGAKTDLSGIAKSDIYAELDSTSIRQEDVTSTSEMPWNIAAGLVYQLTEKIDLNMDVQYRLWNKVDQVMPFEFTDRYWNNRIMIDDSLSGIAGNNITMAMQNSLDFGLGLEFQAPNRLFYRIGYAFNGTPLAQKTYNLLFPLPNRNWLTAGVGHRSERFAIDGSLAYAIAVPRSVMLSENAYYAGTYNSRALELIISMNYFF